MPSTLTLLISLDDGKISTFEMDGLSTALGISFSLLKPLVPASASVAKGFNQWGTISLSSSSSSSCITGGVDGHRLERVLVGVGFEGGGGCLQMT